MAIRGRRRHDSARVGTWGVVASMAMLVLTFCAGCAAPVLSAPVTPSDDKATAATARAGPRPTYQPGEQLEVGVWLSGVPVGKLLTRVGRPCGGEGDEAVEIRTEARAAGPLAEIQGGEALVRTLLDLSSGLPLTDRWRQKVSRPVEYEVHFGADHYWAMSRRLTASSAPRPSSVPSPAHDAHSALGLVRSWDANVGDQQHFYLVVRRTLWRVEVALRGPAQAKTAHDERDAIRIDGVAQRVRRSYELDDKKPVDFALWLSDDPDRVPLRMVMSSPWGEIDARLLRRTIGAEARLPELAVGLIGPPERVAAAGSRGASSPAPSPPSPSARPTSAANRPAPPSRSSETGRAELPLGCPSELGPSESMRQAMAKAERDEQRQRQRLIRAKERARVAAARRARSAQAQDGRPDIAGRVPRGWGRGRGPYVSRRVRGGRPAVRRGELIGGVAPAIDTSEAPLDACGLVDPSR